MNGTSILQDLTVVSLYKLKGVTDNTRYPDFSDFGNQFIFESISAPPYISEG